MSRAPSPDEPRPTPTPGATSSLLQRGRAGARPAALVVAVVALTGACAGSEGPTTSPTTAPPPPISPTVAIVDGRFDPRRVEVAVGGSVTWVNDDVTPHLLVSLTPNVIQSPLIGKAGSYTRSFSQPGEYRYYCNIHNSMKGEVVVR